MKKCHTAILCLLLCCLTLLQVAGGAVVFGVVPAEKASGHGVVVRRVAERTPAHEAGLRAGDEIVSVQGVPTPHAAALKEALCTYAPGDVVRIPPDAMHTVVNRREAELLWAALWWPIME